MKNVLLSICVLLFAGKGLQAQTDDLVIKNNPKGSYVDHKVLPKENFYSIGRLFYVNPKHLASFNSLDMTKGLKIGQVIKIPLTDTNFNQITGNGLPVYYITSNSESLYRVSTSNKNVLIERLRKWNNLTNDNVAAGSRLVVGFLASDAVAAAKVTAPQKTEPINKNDQVVKSQAPIVETARNPIQRKVESQKKEERSQNPEVAQVQPSKDETKPVQHVVSVQSSKQGYFQSSFEQQIKQQPISKEQTVTAGIFKTASGWSDEKYYLLMDGIEAGTILKITNPANNKIIYAKLLGEMNGLKQNEGLNLRISNAAASALDISDTDKFILKLNY
ncbi:MAG TPA: LysM peptidoglycan-binding domain-containing protein [Chitinophagaceae bacterium]|nr:LysM peptidoglycan-binding domain-containing protein [Chitinophagaceae bacterium]